MENKDRLDEFLQRKFAEDDPERRLAFREDYWLQAQALIEAAERRGKRRRALWWWWLTGGAGLLLALGWWWQVGNGIAPVRKGASNAAPAVERSRSETTQNPTARPDNTATNSVGASTASVPEPAAAARPGGENALPSPSSNAGMAPDQTPRHTPNAGSGATHRTGHPVRFETGIPDDLHAGASNVATSLPKGHAVTPEASSKPVEPRATPPPNGAASPTALDGALGISPRDTISRGVGHLAQPPWQVPAILPLRWPLMQASVPPLKMIALPHPPVAESPTPHHDWQWELDAHALATTPTGFLSREKTGTGLGISMGLQRKGSPFSFHACTQWRRQQGNAPDSVYVESSKRLQYSFGYFLDETERHIGTMHWLELPIQAQYHRGQFDAEAGVMPALLVALRGKETQTQSSSLQPDPTLVESRSVGLQNRFVARTTTSLFLGAGWRPTPRLRLALQLYYQPGALLKAPVDVDYNRRQHSAWLGVQLGYVFFHTK